MTVAELIQAQLFDPFRIALMVGLVLTMVRTQAVTGTVLPLALGVLFVAAIIPLTITPQPGVPAITAMATGVVANVVILAAILAVRALIVRARG